MSSAFPTPKHMNMIERLLAEVEGIRPERGAGQETIRARLLVSAIEGGMSLESDLRRLLAEHVRPVGWTDGSHALSHDKADVPYHRQEHMLPSPEEEYNAAELSSPIGTAEHSDTAVIARNTVGETALIRWQPDGPPAENRGRWVCLETNRPFAAARWVPTTWTAGEIRKHSSNPTDRRIAERSGATPSTSSGVLGAIHAFLSACQKEARPPKTAGVAGSLRRAFPELDISDADLADAIIREVARAFVSNADAEVFSAMVPEMSSLETWENEGGAIPVTS